MQLEEFSVLLKGFLPILYQPPPTLTHSHILRVLAKRRRVSPPTCLTGFTEKFSHSPHTVNPSLAQCFASTNSLFTSTFTGPLSCIKYSPPLRRQSSSAPAFPLWFPLIYTIHSAYITSLLCGSISFPSWRKITKLSCAYFPVESSPHQNPL